MRTRHHSSSEEFLLPPQISKGTNVSDGKRDAELIFGAYRGNFQATVFQGDPAAGAVITHLRDLILQNPLLDVIAEPEHGVPPPAVQVTVTDLRADLIRKGLQDSGVIN